VGRGDVVKKRVDLGLKVGRALAQRLAPAVQDQLLVDALRREYLVPFGR
jgi:hypothetical protein